MSNLEYITQARKLLTEDYKTKHTNEYNSWLSNQQHSWMQPHVIVPFPPFVISAALAPFKPTAVAPSESEIVAKALELYNMANPPTPVVAEDDDVVEETMPESVIEDEEEEDVVEETMPESVVEEPVVQEIMPEVTIDNVVEEPAVEEIQTKAPVISYTDAIHKIYEVMKKEGELDDNQKFTSIDAALQVIPQPSEELAKFTNSSKILPTMMEKLQSIWMTKGGSNV